MVTSQLNIRPVFDVHADVQGRDLASAAVDIDKVIEDRPPDSVKATISIALSGQIETMRESYFGMFSGMALAVVLVYLFLVINFQSWIDPLIVLMAVPFALGRRHVDAVSYTDSPKRSRSDGNADVHRADDGKQHSGRDVRQSADGMPAMSRAYGGDRGGIHAVAARADDGRCDDPRHDPDGAWRRRRRRAKRPAGARGDRRTAVRDLCDASICAGDVPLVEARTRQSA